MVLIMQHLRVTLSKGSGDGSLSSCPTLLSTESWIYTFNNVFVSLYFWFFSFLKVWNEIYKWLLWQFSWQIEEAL